MIIYEKKANLEAESAYTTSVPGWGSSESGESSSSGLCFDDVNEPLTEVALFLCDLDGLTADGNLQDNWATNMSDDWIVGWFSNFL